VRSLGARVGVYMDERERERRCRGGLRWKVREWDAVDDDVTTQGGVGGRGEKGFGIMRDGAISMLSEVAQPFDAKSEGFEIFNTMESFCTLWIDYSL